MNLVAQILTDYNIRYESNESLEICLDDFVKYIVESKTEKSIKSYLSRIKLKIKRSGLWYKDAEVTISELCPKLRSKKAKEFYERWRSVNTNTESTDVILSGSSGEQPIIDSEDMDTLVSFLDIRNNYFQYKGKKVFVLVKDGAVWFKGIDIARLLDYDLSNIHRIYAKISEENKMFFDTVNNDGVENQINQHKAIFINLAGMFTMVMKSTKSEAEQFQSWVCNEVLPSINRFGSYSIEKKYGCFYDDHDLYEYDGCNVCYMAYIGVHDGIPLFKYGITFDYYGREYQEHRKTFDTFQLLYLRLTDNNHAIEGLFTNECKIKNIHVEKEFKGKNRKELFTINESHSLERMKMIMDKLIEQNPTKEHEKYKREIQRLQTEKEELKKEYTHKIELQKTIIADKIERVQELQSHNLSLQKDKESLQTDRWNAMRKATSASISNCSTVTTTASNPSIRHHHHRPRNHRDRIDDASVGTSTPIAVSCGICATNLLTRGWRSHSTRL